MDEARIYAFVEDMRGVTVITPDVQARTDVELAWVYATYPDGTAKNKLTIYRNALRACNADHVVLRILKEPVEKRKARELNSAATVNARRSAKTVLPDPQRILERAEALLGSESYTQLGAALAILTGRRPYEIFVTGFAREWEGEQRRVEFCGLSKGHLEQYLKAYPLYVLTNPQRIVEAFQHLRHLRDFSAYLPLGLEYGPYFQVARRQTADPRPSGIGVLSPYELFHNIAKTANDVFKTHFKALIPDCTLYRARAVYECLGMQRFKPIGMSESLFRTRLLLHDETNLRADDNYERFYIAEEN